jgi:hypothetical protein
MDDLFHICVTSYGVLLKEKPLSLKNDGRGELYPFYFFVVFLHIQSNFLKIISASKSPKQY